MCCAADGVHAFAAALGEPLRKRFRDACRHGNGPVAGNRLRHRRGATDPHPQGRRLRLDPGRRNRALTHPLLYYLEPFLSESLKALREACHCRASSSHGAIVVGDVGLPQHNLH